MTAFYDRLALTAAALLLKYGQDVALRRPAAGAAYDAATGTVTPGGPATDTTRKAAAFDFKSGEKETAGGLIKAGDKKVLMEATSPAPTVADKVVFGGKTWEILDVQVVSPAGTDVVHTLHARR